MASLLENLVDILDKEEFEYEKLLILAEKKTSAVVKGDVDSLSKITEDEQEIVGRIQTMEKQRTKVLADVANVVNRDVETLKLIDLIQMLAKVPDQQEKLRDVQERLEKTTQQLRRQNEKNQLLLQEKIEMVDFNLNMIRAMKSAPETANYSKDAYTNGEVLGIFHGGFDAKQ
ncbi:MAG: flagellar protein FlgN [Lachnospiraceae bacterium]|nr:flagellar protein FlgN [Lachnospiraceae bacterium]